MTRFCLSIPALLILVGMALAPAHVHAAPVVFPDTGPAKRFQELMALINAGQRDALLKYARTQFGPSMLKPDEDSIVDFMMGQYERSGGFDARRVMQSVDRQITVLVQGRRNKSLWLRYAVATDPAPPHNVQGLFTFAASAALADETAGTIAASELPGRLQALIDRIAAKGDFSGSVCLVRNDKVLLSQAWGEADREKQILNTPETQFNIASVGKLFTAVAMAKLVESGKVAYTDKAAQYIPDWLPPDARGITIEQLLTHTSGLGDYLDILAEDRSGRAYDRLEDFRSMTLASALAFDPGTSFGYSNLGYVLLGAIIEKVTGARWDLWIQKNVLLPAGMERSSPMRPATAAVATARAYERQSDGSWLDVSSRQIGRGTPAGGGLSTAADLARLAGALRDGTLVSEKMLEQMLTPRADMTGTGREYGYGVTVAGMPGNRLYGHQGGFPGVSALVEIYEADGYVLTVLSNMSDGAPPIGAAWRDLRRQAVMEK